MIKGTQTGGGGGGVCVGGVVGPGALGVVEEEGETLKGMRENRRR